MPDDKYIKVKELASRLGVHPTTIIRWVKAGSIPATRLGPRIFRIARRDVQKMLNDNN